MLLSSFMFSFDGEKKLWCKNYAESLLTITWYSLTFDVMGHLKWYSRPHTVYTQNKKEMICVYLNYKGNDCPDIHKC